MQYDRKHERQPLVGANYDQQVVEELNYPALEGEVRMGFIRKVYGILSIQLIFTAFYAGLCMYMFHAQNKTFIAIMTNQVLNILVLVTYVGSICALACCGFDTMVPANYTLLGIFTFCVSWIVGSTCARVPNPLIVC